VSTPWSSMPKGAAPAGGSSGSLRVVLEPKDARLLLDGAQVKDGNDPQWSAPRLPAGNEHVLTARREGYAEQSVTVTLKSGEERTVSMALAANNNQIVVLSSPPNAQVWVDGEKKGLTPALLGSLDPAAAHAITVEKKCYRS